jgi:leukotriene-A4 hydrolase
MNITKFVKHYSFNLEINFEKNIFNGYVDYVLNEDNEITELILDSSKIQINKIEAENEELDYKLSEEDKVFGSKLTINTKTFNKIRIYYTTSPDASSIKWLSPEQTEGKKHPYLFSQFQAIHGIFYIFKT